MIVIKIGGSIVEGLHQSIFEDLANLLKKEKIIIIHGGGKEVTSTALKMGKEQKFVVSPEGKRSRYTDEETSIIYTMVMSGKVNKQITSMLSMNGIPSVGLTGIDGTTIRATRKKKLVIINEKGRKMIIDGGFTGKISNIDTKLINLLLDNGYTPVISPVAVDENYNFLNVDGDRAAAYIAGALNSEVILFLTNVNGLIMSEKLVKSISLEESKIMLPKIGPGMEKKVLAATESIEMGVKKAIISSGGIENPIMSALSHDNCTVIMK